MSEEVNFLGVRLKNRFVLASGVLGVTISSLRRVFLEGAGIVTTKSIGPEIRKGYRGSVIHFWKAGLINAVGLSNPGIDQFIAQCKNDNIDFPLIVSIFGKKEEDFPVLASKLENLKFDFIELNISCPNVLDEFGIPFSHSPMLTSSIIKKVKKVSTRPVIVKLSPAAPDLLKVADYAQEAGANALCIANTLGPGMIIDTHTGIPILGNKKGGLSGDAILPVTVRCIYEVYKQVSIPIIGTGGVSDFDGALQLLMAGASMVGIGSGVYSRGISIFKNLDNDLKMFLKNNNIKDSCEIIGISHKQKKRFFFSLPDFLSDERMFSVKAFSTVSMKSNFSLQTCFKVTTVKKICYHTKGELQTIFFDSSGITPPTPGQFFMLWIPEIDQKPFSVSCFNSNNVGFTVLKRGVFSSRFLEIKQGEPVGMTGPLGKGFNIDKDNYLLVGGGIGLAPLVFTMDFLLKMGKRATLLAGGKSCKDVKWVSELFKMNGWKPEIYFYTEDGSKGGKGIITQHLSEVVEKVNPQFALVCAPELCIVRCLEIFEKFGIPGEASIERMMKCGIGLCGSCTVDPTGDRVCKEGPVFSFDYLKKLTEFGRYRRDESGTILSIE